MTAEEGGMNFMDAQDCWIQILKSQPELSDGELRSLVRLLLHEKEDFLIEKLKRHEEQSFVLECLGYLGTEKALPWILRSLSEREEALQLAAAAALKNFPQEWLLEPLMNIVLKQLPGAAKAGEVLLSLGQDARDLLWEAWFIEDNDSTVRAQILALLTEANDPRSEAIAFLALESDEDELIKAGLSTVAALESQALWGNVANCLNHPNWAIRGKAVNILAQLNATKALPLLEDMPPDEDSWVEESRVICIELLRNKLSENRN